MVFILGAKRQNCLWHEIHEAFPEISQQPRKEAFDNLLPRFVELGLFVKRGRGKTSCKEETQLFFYLS